MNLNGLDQKTRGQIEYNRELWVAIARDPGWYTEPFYVQVWINKYGNVSDSVAFRSMTEDIILPADDDEED